VMKETMNHCIKYATLSLINTNRLQFYCVEKLNSG
jgi:hypothetical protein